MLPIAESNAACLFQGGHLAQLLTFQSLGQGTHGQQPRIADALGPLSHQGRHGRGVDHRISVSKGGYDTASDTLRLESGRSREIHVSLDARYGEIEISSEPAHRFRGAVGSLEQIAARVDKDREFGAYILPQENAVAAACRDAVSQLRKLADQKHRAALEAEDRAFNRPLSEQEISFAESAANTQAATMAIVGVNMDTGHDKEAPFIAMRVTESQRHLRDARAWDLDEYDDPTTEPSSRRALERGDTMLARANDPAQGLEMRDDLYQDAEKYFQFGGFSKQAKAAESQRDAIQPALQAEKARREQQRDAALEQKAAAMQQAVDDMQKTEAEKQSFNEEADAMEAELGF